MTKQSQNADLEARLAAVSAIGAVMSNAVGLDALFSGLVPEITKLIGAERSTLFLYDEPKQEIWSKVAEGDGVKEIRLPLGHGIAGYVAQTRVAENIPDAYADQRFNPDVDKMTGFTTKAILAIPVTGAHSLLGVIQVLNRKGGGPFNEAEFSLLEAIGAQTRNAIENAHMAQALLDQNAKLDLARNKAEKRGKELDLLYQLERETSVADDLDQLLDSIIVRACKRLRSDAGCVLLTDDESGKLFFRGLSGEKSEELRKLQLNVGEGVVGWVAKNGKPLMVNDPRDESRHQHELAGQLNFPATALLAVPLIWDGRTIGAVEVLNPKNLSETVLGYDDDDLKILTLIAGQVARAVTLAQKRKMERDLERLAAVGGMLAGVAHDLRNPMTVISGYAQLMAMELSSEQRQQHSDSIVEQVDEMTGMLSDLLAFSRGDSNLKNRKFEVGRLRDEVEQSLKHHTQPRGIGLSVTGGGKGWVLGDVGRIKRILYNLAKNAIEVITKGDCLTVRIDYTEPTLDIHVEDTGPGIPDDLGDRIFEPFVTMGKENGTGLGLAIVKRFVDDLRGNISMKSSAHGTIFHITLPLKEEAKR